jgi:hypothetical protein
MEKICLIFSSHFPDVENEKFIAHLKATAGIEVHVECVKNMNQYSLTEAYNIGWKRLDDLNLGKEIIVFCHNDIEFKSQDWGKTLLFFFNKYQDYDIIGIAGSDQVLEHGVWYLNEQRQVYAQDTHMFGRVWHTNGVREIESIYTRKINGIKEAVIVDGLFFAINGATIVKRFNEDYKNFHYYDVTFCFENFLEGCNIGVIDKISVLHQSIGMTNQNWENNRLQFVDQFKADLPISCA